MESLQQSFIWGKHSNDLRSVAHLHNITSLTIYRDNCNKWQAARGCKVALCRRKEKSKARGAPALGPQAGLLACLMVGWLAGSLAGWFAGLPYPTPTLPPTPTLSLPYPATYPYPYSYPCCRSWKTEAQMPVVFQS